MKLLLQLEELAMMAMGIAGLYYQPIHINWWLWPILFLSPDISMVGYIVNTSAGAFTYDLFHHKGIAIVIAATGFYFSIDWLMLAGIILFAHSSFDRVMGYGLKYADDFKHTHLGWMGGQE